MKSNQPQLPPILPAQLSKLRLSTRVLLHPDFARDPVIFALRLGVDMVGDVLPTADFRNDREANEKTVEEKPNIHLAGYKFIRLFTEKECDALWLRSIDLNPSLLLHGQPDHPISDTDLSNAFGILKAKVTPLLANPSDAVHLIPGHAAIDDRQVAYWTQMRWTMWLPGIDMECLHDVSHPNTGPAEGRSRKRMYLGSRGDHWQIGFKKVDAKTGGPGGSQTFDGVRVRLTLEGDALCDAFKEIGTARHILNQDRLVAFPLSTAASVVQSIMAELKGYYMPVPNEWTQMGKPATHAKAIALMSHLTGIPVDEIRALDERLRAPSDSTKARLHDDIEAASACLHRTPIARLFQTASSPAGHCLH